MGQTRWKLEGRKKPPKRKLTAAERKQLLRQLAARLRKLERQLTPRTAADIERAYADPDDGD